MVTPEKKHSRRFPPIVDPHEWIFYDWEHSIIIRNLEHSVSKSTEWPMPDEFKIENGCRFRRLDTGEIIDQPLSFCRFSVGPKLFYFDDFLGERVFIETACEVIPGMPKQKPKPSKSKAASSSVSKPKVKKSQAGRLF